MARLEVERRGYDIYNFGERVSIEIMLFLSDKFFFFLNSLFFKSSSAPWTTVQQIVIKFTIYVPLAPKCIITELKRIVPLVFKFKLFKTWSSVNARHPATNNNRSRRIQIPKGYLSDPGDLTFICILQRNWIIRLIESQIQITIRLSLVLSCFSLLVIILERVC